MKSSKVVLTLALIDEGKGGSVEASVFLTPENSQVSLAQFTAIRECLLATLKELQNDCPELVSENPQRN